LQSGIFFRVGLLTCVDTLNRRGLLDDCDILLHPGLLRYNDTLTTRGLLVVDDTFTTVGLLCLKRYTMVNRYMIKMFFKNLWVSWRYLEGLNTMPGYEEAKLGMNTSKHVDPWGLQPLPQVETAA